MHSPPLCRVENIIRMWTAMHIWNLDSGRTKRFCISMRCPARCGLDRTNPFPGWVKNCHLYWENSRLCRSGSMTAWSLPCRGIRQPLKKSWIQQKNMESRWPVSGRRTGAAPDLRHSGARWCGTGPGIASSIPGWTNWSKGCIKKGFIFLAISIPSSQ